MFLGGVGGGLILPIHLYIVHICIENSNIFLSETTGPISIYPGRNVS